ncbi:MAG: hypothetical protein H8E55_07905 [Pelagibacterales bacterium]|nr:hypothetical protein [Pelagibacterales bacterium]
MSLGATDFSTLNLTKKINLLENKDIMTEFDSALDPKKPIKIQSIEDKAIIFKDIYTIYGWEPAVILKFKYISRNKMTKKKKEEFWERVIWNGNNKLEDTDIILENGNIKLKLPFRFLTKEESEKAGSSKLVRGINASDKLRAVAKTAAVANKFKARGYVENHSFYDDELGTEIDVVIGGGRRKKRRRKKKNKKAFPSRKKNNRKNRTKKKALSK